VVSPHCEVIPENLSRSASSSSTPTNSEPAPTGPIYTLPPELILNICDYLPGVDILSFCHASHWLRAIFQNYTLWTISTKDRSIFYQNWLTSVFPGKAVEEIRSQKASRKRKFLLCSFCCKSHSISAFESEERDKSPFDRKCIGSVYTVQMCPHLTFTLQKMRQYRLDAGLHPLSCCVAMGRKHFLFKDGPGNQLESKCMPQSSTIRTYADDYARYEQIASALTRLDEYICPHMRSSDAALHRRLFDLRRATSHSIIFLSLDVSVKCKHAHCDTFVRVSHGRCGEMGVELTRRFENLKNAGDKSWCAQLERGVRKSWWKRMFEGR
jgi:hypothetical protein